MKSVHSLALAIVAVLCLAIGYYVGTQTNIMPGVDMMKSEVTADDKGASSAKTDSKVLATVNGKDITEADVETLYNSLPPQYRQAPIAFLKDQLLQQMISMEVIEQAAEAEKLGDQQEFRDRLSTVRTQLMQEYYLKKKIEELVTNDLVKAEYDKLVADFKPEEEVHARHILLKTEEEAKDLIKLLEGGGDFVALAKEYSTGPSGPNGGDLGYFTKERMVPEFATPAFALAKGEYTKTPVKTQFGYHVIKVEDKRETQPPSFDEKQAELHGKVENTVIEKLINELKAAASIVLIAPEPAEEKKAEEGADAKATPAAESTKKE